MSGKFISLLLFFVLFSSACGEGKKQPLAVGDKAPDFTAVSLTGETIQLSDWKGSPIILRFWSTDCKYCRADTPIFNQYFTKYNGKGLRMLYVNTGPEPMEEIKSFAAELDIVFPVIGVGGAALGAQYNVKIVPQTIFIAPDGTILTAILGGVGEAEFSEILGKYL
ncbi:MAG: TlpA family protein disulfide reductase [Desulfocapsa sp.]|nr:TlpA family protein disulfide reductase [Desulfocapsa sp.]